MKKGAFNFESMIPITAVFLFIMFLPFIITFILWIVFPNYPYGDIFQLIFKAFLAISIFMFVRNFTGDGVVTYVIAGILIWIFLFKLYIIFTMGYMLYLIVSMMLSGIIIFGLQKH